MCEVEDIEVGQTMHAMNSACPMGMPICLKFKEKPESAIDI